MKKFICAILFLSVFVSCSNKIKPIVSTVFVDSLLKNCNNSSSLKNAETELNFWKNRIKPGVFDLVNQGKYAGQLVRHFNLLGNINDVNLSDSILYNNAEIFKGKEVSPYMGLIRNAILQHKFQLADSLLTIAQKIGIQPYDEACTAFDVNFELGKMTIAKSYLQKINMGNDFGYQFRKSKYKHYQGELDSSITAMKNASDLANGNVVLRQSALSNLADLYIHAGKLNQAYKAYVNCIKTDAADLHSIMGIGWIALIHDKNDSLAEKIFRLVATKTQSPEPLFKLVAVAEQRGDTALQKKYAASFAEKASNKDYGAMYNKYLIQLYTSILNNPAKAEEMAYTELQNRNTAQTNAWYSYALLINGKKDSAYRIYERKVSGKPLEALELYYMGELMKTSNKGYNAQQYFTEANKTKYDLSPLYSKEIAKFFDE